MEDVKIGRKTTYQTRTVTVANGSTSEIIGADPNRLSITIGVAAATPGNVLPGPTGASATVGYRVARDVPPVHFHLFTHGQAVLDKWNGFADGADVVFTITTASFVAP